jgi:hypothetical protein
MRVAVRVPAGPVAVPVVREVVRPSVIEAAFPVPVTAVLPRRGTIPDACLRTSHDREVPDDLLRLPAAIGAGRELEGVAHGHALLEALAALWTLVFVESHGAMVERVAR